MANKALIIGANGQDGRLLNLLLESKNYEIYNVSSSSNTDFKNYLQFNLATSNFDELNNFILKIKPQEIYYVAAYHHSSIQSKSTNLDFINKSIQVNQLGFINIMELCKASLPLTKIIYTSSSLIFSGAKNQVQTEETTTEPRCIYSITKSAASEAAKYYRNEFNLFVSIGIMYNHESIYRKDYFLSKKIVTEVREIIDKKRDKIIIGSLTSETDWGYAPDYVEALWLILQQENPDNYIVASSNKHIVKDWFLVLSNYLNTNLLSYVEENPSLIQRKKPVLIGNNSKLKAIGWKAKTSFEEMVIKMYNNVI